MEAAQHGWGPEDERPPVHEVTGEVAHVHLRQVVHGHSDPLAEQSLRDDADEAPVDPYMLT